MGESRGRSLRVWGHEAAGARTCVCVRAREGCVRVCVCVVCVWCGVVCVCVYVQNARGGKTMASRWEQSN